MSSSVSVNRLVDEISPYLRQHSTNPVDWRPWDEATRAEIRDKNKPVFLSIGYASCHWCHVMEREAFSDLAVADVLNNNFIPIKVDREEHPEIDHLYMTVTQALTGRGGWPNNLWLTPELRPFHAGNYFSASALRDLSARLARSWSQANSELEGRARQIINVLEQINAKMDEQPRVPLDSGLIDQAVKGLHFSFDDDYGGFSGSPKFPPHAGLFFLLRKQKNQKGKKELSPALLTLEAMARGGIHDHIGGGFHRYSVDEKWQVPHFEKMLYDNALLLLNYSLGWELTRQQLFHRVAMETGDWILREMNAPEGGFCSSLDADCHGQEGGFYLWTRRQVEEILPAKEAQLFCSVYAISDNGNFMPQSGQVQAEKQNIPYLPVSIEEYARSNRRKPRKLAEQLQKQRRRLLEQRNRRLTPQRDEKVLTDWNGLAIYALAAAGAALPEPRFLEAAVKAADYLLENAVSKEGDLVHSFRSRTNFINGNLDDYAFFIRGLLELDSRHGAVRWCEAAEDLTWRSVAEFADRKRGGFYFTRKNEIPTLRRHRDAFDQATPSGNAVITECLLLLYQQTRQNPYLEIAESTLKEFSGAMHSFPLATLGMLTALQDFLDNE